MKQTVTILTKQDTGWENISGDGKVQGRIKNGMATIAIQNFSFIGTEGQLQPVFSLPKKYSPSESVFFALLENAIKPNAYSAFIRNDGIILAHYLHANNNVVGSVSYPV